VQIHRAFVLLGLAVILVWGTAAQDDGMRIGVVDIDQAISATTEGKAAREELARKKRADFEANPRYTGRPTKRQRRKLADFLNEP